MSTAASRNEEARLGKARDVRLVRRLLPYLRPGRRSFIAAILLLVPVSALTTLQPLLMKYGVDHGFVPGGTRLLVEVGLACFGIAVLDGLARFMHLYLVARGGQESMAALRMRLLRHLQSVQLRYFDRTPIGRITTRATSDVDTVTEAFSTATSALTDLFLLVVLFAAMIAVNARLALAMLVVLPVLAFVVTWFTRRAREAFREIRTKTAQINAMLAEQVQGIVVVQAFSRMRRCAREFDVLNARYRDVGRTSMRYDVGIYALVDAFGDVVVAALLVAAAWTITDARVTAGTMVAFIEIVRRFFLPVRELSGKFNTLQSALASLERIVEMFDEADLEPRSGVTTANVAAAGEQPVLRLDRVEFKYGRGDPVLQGVSLTVHRGEKVALVGATGAGKSSIVQLALRLYEAQGGRVEVLGVDVKQWDPIALRRRFAFVGQDVFLFAGDIVSNVAMGDVAADRERVAWALEQVSAMDRFAARGGLDARVDERGTNFSAGERQLLAFARALYRDPEFLILDEATASIDSDTEALVQRALRRILQGRTALVVAHRLSTIRDADRIVVLVKGRLVEEGTHAELLAKGGAYARLHSLHFGVDEGAPGLQSG